MPRFCRRFPALLNTVLSRVIDLIGVRVLQPEQSASPSGYFRASDGCDHCLRGALCKMSGYVNALSTELLRESLIELIVFMVVGPAAIRGRDGVARGGARAG